MSVMAFQDIQESTGLYYYIHMKKFERLQKQMERKIKKYHTMAFQEKRMLHQNLQDQRHRIFNFRHLQEEIRFLSPLPIESVDDLFQLLARVRLFRCIQGAKGLNCFFPCVLIEGNWAWVSKDAQGHYRYFSKRSGMQTIGLDTLDLLEIYYGVPPESFLSVFLEELQIQSKEEKWQRQQSRKYEKNLRWIHDWEHQVSAYPFLLKCLGEKQIQLLEALHHIAKEQIKKKEFVYEGDSVFFLSSSYLSHYLKTSSSSTVNKMVNWLVVLGFIRKVKEEDIPSSLLIESKRIAKMKNVRNIISYYTIPLITHSLLEKANERAQRLCQYQMSYSTITYQKISMIFGDPFAQTIYVQNIQKKSCLSISHPSAMEKRLERALLHLIQKKGYATKTMILKMYKGKESKKNIQKVLNDMWKDLLSKHHFIYVKPTKSMKKQWSLPTEEYVVIPSSIIK